MRNENLRNRKAIWRDSYNYQVKVKIVKELDKNLKEERMVKISPEYSLAEYDVPLKELKLL